MLGYVIERHTYIGTATNTCSLRRFTETEQDCSEMQDQHLLVKVTARDDLPEDAALLCRCGRWPFRQTETGALYAAVHTGALGLLSAAGRQGRVLGTLFHTLGLKRQMQRDEQKSTQVFGGDFCIGDHRYPC